MPVPERPPGVGVVREPAVDGGVPRFVHPGWREEHPWLIQGTTGRGGADPFDLGLFGATPVGEVLARWRDLRDATATRAAAHSIQVHGAAVQQHRPAALHPGLVLSEGFDGHVTETAGLLLTVSVADCVPISLVGPADRRIALLHGGWRGAARGILGAGLDGLGVPPRDVHVHLGPAICGRCYEVGPEVHAALGLAIPPEPAPVDVRAVLARQAIAAGIPAEQVSVSEHCTRCGTGFFSHRGGDAGRQLGFLALRS